jgi:DNA-binding transcriptional LysR family regulator
MDRLDDMTAFVRVVEDGNFSAAARSLHLTPSGVSKLIGRLEDRLGVRLIQRTTRRLALTAEGRVFYERCRDILAEIEGLEQDVGAARSEPRGTVRVSLSNGFGLTQVVPLLPEFSGRYPKVQIVLIFQEHIVDLIAEGFDLAIRLGAIRDESLVARRLGEHRRVVCAAPSYLDAQGVPQTPEDLSRHDCLMFDAPEALNHWPFRWPDGRSERVAVQGTFRSNNGEALYNLLLAGTGIANAADFLVKRDLLQGRLVPLLRDYAEPQPTLIHAVYPHRRHLPAKTRVFVDFLADRFAGSPWAF